MSKYINLATLKYPCHEGDIRLEYPEILETQTGNDFICPPSYAQVEWVDPPEIDVNKQKADEGAPVQDGDVWKMSWMVRALTDDEKDMRQIELGLKNNLTVERL